MFDPYSSAEQEKANSAVRAGGYGSAGRPALGKSFVLLGSQFPHLQNGSDHVGLQKVHLGLWIICTSQPGAWHTGVSLPISQVLLSSENQLSLLFVMASVSTFC